MTPSAWTPLLVIAAVAVLSLVLRARSGVETVQLPRDDEPPPGAGPDADDDDSEWGDGEAVAITVDGLAFIGAEHGVHLAPLPQHDPLYAAPGRMNATEFLRAGDFSAGRIVKGSSEDPWRLELLGPEGEYMHYGFATDEAATAALGLLEQREVMRYVRDEDDRPLRPSAEQFAEARSRAEESERELAMTLDQDPPEPR